MIVHETTIPEVARRLWEFSGRPEGRDLEFWCMAERWMIRESSCRARLTGQLIMFPGKADPATAERD
jgi:Protein of unknown function (DUF2934)